MRIYDVYDGKSGELLVSGTATQCAKELGLSKSGFQSATLRSRDGRNRMYQIVEAGEKPPKRVQQPVDKDLLAIQAWDAFMEPLRKEFGIPVYTPEKGERNG